MRTAFRIFLLSTVFAATAVLQSCKDNDGDMNNQPNDPSVADQSGQLASVEAISFGEAELLLWTDADEALLTPRVVNGYDVRLDDWTFIEAYEYDAALFGVADVDPWMPIDITGQGEKLDCGWLTAEKVINADGSTALKVSCAENFDEGRCIKLVVAVKNESKTLTGSVCIKQISAYFGYLPPLEAYTMQGAPEHVAAEGESFVVEVIPADRLFKVFEDPNLWSYAAREYQRGINHEYINFEKPLEWIEVTREGNTLIVNCKPNDTGYPRKAYVAVNIIKDYGEVALGFYSSQCYHGMVEFVQDADVF